MGSEAELLKAIYDEIRAANRNLGYLVNRVDLLEMLLIPEEEISQEDAEHLDRLAEETRKKGVPWEQVKSDLNL